MADTFQAFIVDKKEEKFTAGVKDIAFTELADQGVLIKVHYSGVNYKDAMASVDNSKIVRQYPRIIGIDLAGEVVESSDSNFKQGDRVIATSYEIGVSHHGGFSEYARIPAEWIVPLPEGLTMKEAMILGTAGFTAALSIHRLEENGLTPESGKVLVSGATGGVGSLAIAMLARRNYHVVASSGKAQAASFLKEIGAVEVISREAVSGGDIKPLDKRQWAAAVDPVGGKTLASILSKLDYRGAVAASGLTGGTDIPATVYPFILRSVSLIGADSSQCPLPVRTRIWERLAADLKPAYLEKHVQQEIRLSQLPDAFQTLLDSRATGRHLLRLV